MKVVKGRVVETVSPNKDGSFWVEIGDQEATRVTYTSPSYNPNQGGLFAPPAVDQEVLLFEVDSVADNNPDYLYISTIVDDEPISSSERIPEFEAIRAGGDGSAYDKSNRPVKMTLQNANGQGISTINDISNSSRTNHVSLDAETGSYVAAGEQGCQVVNEHLDGIVVQGEPNGLFPARSITMSTDGPQFQESNASLNMTVGQSGDDINICNLANTSDLGGGGVTAGNIRIHSKNKDIILRTGAPGTVANGSATRNINIITPKAQIQINGQTGDISIQSNEGNVNVESGTGINMTAPTISLNGNTTINGTLTATTGTASVSLGAAGLDVVGGAVGFQSASVKIDAAAFSTNTAAPPAFTTPSVPAVPGAIPAMVLHSPTPPAAGLPAPTTPAVPIEIVDNSYGDAPD